VLEAGSRKLTIPAPGGDGINCRLGLDPMRMKPFNLS
jgi:hypothetical protein